MHTRLSVDILEAIENGNFHLLPVPVYSRNFIKIYTRFLNADNRPLLDCYEAYLESQKPVEPSLEEEPEEKFARKISNYRNYFWALAAFILVAALSLWFIFFQYNPPAEIQPYTPESIVLNKTPESVVSEPNPPDLTAIAETETATGEKKIDPPAPQPKKVAAKPAATPNTPAKQQKTPPISIKPNTVAAVPAVPVLSALAEEPSVLIIKAHEETWLRIKADNDEPFQVLLQPGEKIQRKAAIFDMDIGNAGGIKIQFKGKTIENMGKSGEVIHLRLPE